MNSPNSTAPRRVSTGVPGLDQHLGGGLLAGTLTVIVGATGVGKTQLGLQFANVGQAADGRRGVLFDMSVRGDSQSHAVYAQRMFDWRLQPFDLSAPLDAERIFPPHAAGGDYLHVFDDPIRPKFQPNEAWDHWRAWKTEMVAKLDRSIAFFYGNFIRGSRRVVIDGVDPVDRPIESIQFELFEYVYHQIVRKDSDWVARDLFRQQFRELTPRVTEHQYDQREIACLMQYTSREVMLDDLMARPIEEGDWLAHANTVIYMGRFREGNQMGRGMYIAKHRGSSASEAILPFRIDDAGLKIS